MADRKGSATPKKRAKRPYIKVYVTAEQKAQIQRQVPDKEVAQYCRDRIFNPSGLRDTAVDVGARLLAMAARQKRIGDALAALKTRLDDDLARARAIPNDDPEHAFLGLLAKQRHEELVALIEDARPNESALLDEARELCRLIAHRQEQSRAVPTIDKRESR
ncbi:MAG: hypothetical protein CL868_18760 [Cytophagaceae bacterium]|nr:hypothetical protein [Cytophagaceae bacterium]